MKNAVNAKNFVFPVIIFYVPCSAKCEAKVCSVSEIEGGTYF